MENNWIPFRKELPLRDTSFLVTFDGYWVKAHRGNKNIIVIDLHSFGKGDCVLPIERFMTKYWLPVPSLPI